MKKIMLLVGIIIIICGCDNNMMNTPTKKVEKFLNSYQMLEQDVLDDLDNVVINSDDLNDSQKEKYISIMKKHYQNLKYKIKDEEVNGDSAIVTVEIEVDDYSKVLSNANTYATNNKEEFQDEENNFNKTKFIDYELEKLDEVTDTVKYTLEIKTTKVNGKWNLDALSSDDMDKINGTYNY